ncbi:hypothetical protein N7468_000771 [Penicillium chermesinum]|uniref:HTH psq-type domain-containing protein n=1 Tax=Penicillium chermesinum TaxID=63820 RepID=A0A9W9TZN9_9EURO|nr:uncharacterized protein N7468_000771 [Penicillium chermesinum]KAJ5249320.1 hypothetical protein N7468_000771 [Penicillium chermesinum]
MWRHKSVFPIFVFARTDTPAHTAELRSPHRTSDTSRFFHLQPPTIPPKRAQIQSNSEGEVALAVKAIREKKIASIREAARVHGVSEATIRNRLQEESLKQWILDLDLRGTSPRQPQVKWQIYLRPSDPESPSNFPSPTNGLLRERAARHLRFERVAARTIIGPGKPPTPSNPSSDKSACVRREVLTSFVVTIDKFLAGQKDSEGRAFACGFSKTFIQYVFTEHFAATNNFVPLRARNDLIQSDLTMTSSSAKSISWAAP